MKTKVITVIESKSYFLADVITTPIFINEKYSIFIDKSLERLYVYDKHKSCYTSFYVDQISALNRFISGKKLSHKELLDMVRLY